MPAQEWIQLQIIHQQHSHKMDETETELTKRDYQRGRADNINLIIGNKLQIEMAKNVIKMLDKKIASFPDEQIPMAEEETETTESEE